MATIWEALMAGDRAACLDADGLPVSLEPHADGLPLYIERHGDGIYQVATHDILRASADARDAALDAAYAGVEPTVDGDSCHEWNPAWTSLG